MIWLQALGWLALFPAIGVLCDAIIFRLTYQRWPRWGTENHD